jgi:hypothetical protein
MADRCSFVPSRNFIWPSRGDDSSPVKPIQPIHSPCGFKIPDAEESHRSLPNRLDRETARGRLLSTTHGVAAVRKWCVLVMDHFFVHAGLAEAQLY